MLCFSRAAGQGLRAAAYGLAAALTFGLPLTGTASAQALRASPALTETSDAGFRPFIESLWPDAKARGVSRETFDGAFQDLAPDPKIIGLTQKQSEFVQPIWGYLAAAVGERRLSRGQEAAGQWADALERIERSYGVPRSIVLGVWGMETNFGSARGGMDVIRSLATLAYAGHRRDFFRGELMVALDLLQRGLGRGDLKGSWAGAMGHTQFMPSSYVKYAADGDGDGVGDIWASVPDALASTANYLRQHGWQPGLPWGFEVAIPEGFDFRIQRQSFSGWSGLGLRRKDGQAMPRAGEAALFLPGGARGPAFLVTDNYDVIKAYNASDAYALGVAHLGDRILGGAPIRGEWPVNEPPLGREERVEVQRRLAALGHYAGEADGKLGSKTREALRQFQLKRGLVADGYANLSALKELRAERAYAAQQR
jgi:membrane-bound lytic murein transglycosylase B